MTMITVSTVGYGEVGQMNDAARLFSVFLIISSLGVVGYIFSSLMTYALKAIYRKIGDGEKGESKWKT